jgi:hypothetical protein
MGGQLADLFRTDTQANTYRCYSDLFVYVLKEENRLKENGVC